MKLTINRDYFLKGLTIVAKAISPKSPLPVLTNIKLELNDKGLVLIGSNNDLAIENIIPFNVGDIEIIRDYEKGAILLANKFITEIIRRIEGEEVSLEVIDDTIVQINDGKSEFTLNSIDAKEYPEIDLEVEGIELNFNKDKFIEMVDQTAFAASTKDTRPTLKAVNFECIDNLLTMTATDSARLAKKRINLDCPNFKINIPATVLVEVRHLIENANEIKLAITNQKVLFLFDNTVISSRLIDGEYPNTNHFFNHSFSYYLEASSQELISAMERVSLLSVERENVIDLIMTEDSVEISARSSQIGSAVESLKNFQYTGERLQISFNSVYVMQAIKATKSEDVTIAFMGEMKPFVIKNVKDESLVQFVTPLRTYY